MPEFFGGMYMVAFRGEALACDSHGDAIAVKAAEDVLSNAEGCEQSPERLDEIVRVLTRYGLVDAAGAVADQADLLRMDPILVAGPK